MPLSGGNHFDFFVEAGAAVGMGHLSRAASLMKQLELRGKSSSLHLFGDSLGESFAQKRGLATQSVFVQTQSPVAIIDAVTFPKDALEKIATYPVRIVISPSFQSLDIATHYLARSKPVSGSLGEETYIDVDEDYAFVTSTTGPSQNSDYESIMVGICITGGRSNTGFELAELILELTSISEIRVISSGRPPQSIRAQDHFIHCKETLDPWSFLSNCNRFIGGDGLMVSEAVAMHKPTFSFVTDLPSPKNLGLISKGAILPFSWEDVESGQLGRYLTDSAVAQRLRQACEFVFSAEKSEKLASSILELAQIYQEEKGT